MAELREAHLRYLLAIYELSRSNPDVGIQAVAKALNCSKASVTKMAGNLMDMGLLVREKYGKIYLRECSATSNRLKYKQLGEKYGKIGTRELGETGEKACI